MYLDRRRFLAGMGIGVAALSLPLTACGANDKPAPLATLKLAKRSEQAGGEKLTEFETVSTYNNYYEFGTDKSDPSRDRKSVVLGKSVSVRVDLGGRRIIKKKTNMTRNEV